MKLLKADRVIVVEYDDSTRQPRPAGQRYPAIVVKAEGLYVIVAYDDKRLTRTGEDQFYAESGWRAWDGEFRWRLHGLDT